jgi:hypothetical protein
MEDPRGPDRRSGLLSRRWHRVVTLAFVLTIVAFVGWVGFGGRPATAPTIDQAKATSLAQAFYDQSHGAGATLANVQVLSVVPGTDDRGHSVWKVNIVGEVTEAGASIAYASVMWLYVDAETGAVTVFAQG